MCCGKRSTMAAKMLRSFECDLSARVFVQSLSIGQPLGAFLHSVHICLPLWRLVGASALLPLIATGRYLGCWPGLVCITVVTVAGSAPFLDGLCYRPSTRNRLHVRKACVHGGPAAVQAMSSDLVPQERTRVFCGIRPIGFRAPHCRRAAAHPAGGAGLRELPLSMNVHCTFNDAIPSIPSIPSHPISDHGSICRAYPRWRRKSTSAARWLVASEPCSCSIRDHVRERTFCCSRQVCFSAAEASGHDKSTGKLSWRLTLLIWSRRTLRWLKILPWHT